MSLEGRTIPSEGKNHPECYSIGIVGVASLVMAAPLKGPTVSVPPRLVLGTHHMNLGVIIQTTLKL